MLAWVNGKNLVCRSLTVAKPQVVKPMKLCISFLVWEIHKPIAGDVGSNVGAWKMDNQCVEKIPLFDFCWMERRPPTVGRYPGAYLPSLPYSASHPIRLFPLGPYPPPQKSIRP